MVGQAFIRQKEDSPLTFQARAAVFFAEQYLHNESQKAASDFVAHVETWRGKEIKMEYLVVLATMLMIAGYALIIGRCVHNSD